MQEAKTMLFLSQDELAELTRKHRKSAQLRVLRFLGIEHKIRPDGSILVSRSHIERALGGDYSVFTSREKFIEPNWNAVNA